MDRNPILAKRGRHNALKRWRDPDDPAIADAERDLRAGRLEQFIRDAVASAPPLTAEQRNKLALLLRVDPDHEVGGDGLDPAA